MWSATDQRGGEINELSTAEERTMSTTEDQSSPREESGIDRLERLLEDWRAKIDDLLVQVDLASKDVSEDLRSRATAAENMHPYLSAQCSLRQSSFHPGLSQKAYLSRH